MLMSTDLVYPIMLYFWGECIEYAIREVVQHIERLMHNITAVKRHTQKYWNIFVVLIAAVLEELFIYIFTKSFVMISFN